MNATPLLLLDDDNEFRKLLAEELQDAGFQPAEAATVVEAERMALDGPVRFEALILDVRLPDGDGRDLCARLRAAGLQMPAIMLAGSNEEDDVVRGLEAGAHDYVAKPVRTAVLIARLQAQLRLHQSSMDAVFTLGPWTFHPAEKLLRGAAGVRIVLTEKEVKLLRHLQRAGRAVSNQQADPAVRGLGLQRFGVVPHARNPRLSAAPEDRSRSPKCLFAVDGGERVSAGLCRGGSIAGSCVGLCF